MTTITLSRSAAVLLLVLCLAAVPAGAMINPSAGYCVALGYEYVNQVSADGSMNGYCLLPGNRSVDAWQFLQGKVAPELSYCKKTGLEIRTVDDPAVCGLQGTPCGICVMADGSGQEVTAMMGLDFRERICSGNTCCDPAKESTCAIGKGTDGSQTDNTSLLILTALIVIVILAAAAYLVLRKGKRKGKNNRPDQENP